MEKTLLPGDRVIVEKWHYGMRLPQSYISLPFTDTIPGMDVPARLPYEPLPYKRLWLKQVQYNDVIAYNYPSNEPKPLSQLPTVVARCVAMSGDTIESHNGNVHINGQPLEQSDFVCEAYLVADSLLPVVENAMLLLWGNIPPHKSIEDKSLFLIDRKNYDKLSKRLSPSQLPQRVALSHDNYYIELPPYGRDATITPHNAAMYAHIINRYEPHKVELHGDTLYCDGKILTTYRFSQPYYWVLCDNRTSSTDSRTLGVLPHSHVIGRCGMIVFSIDAEKRGFASWRLNRFFKWSRL